MSIQVRIPCYLEFDESTSTVTMRHTKTGCIQMMIKVEACTSGTISRIEPDSDCDNFWIGVKPADSVVFEDGLFGRKNLIVKSVDFELKSGKENQR